ncbi:MAG: DUF3108 domain-containing protein [Candidatus Omnitrophica bacterium]|nr:DUF3108 domain-containing protein [Candidatus Omnitrophota bacterium]MBU1924416.1 DUF3108 domain-containing protein [Candidatus Omnitrophota bacterium]
MLKFGKLERQKQYRRYWKENVEAPEGELESGEVFHYKVIWLGVDVGKASLAINGNLKNKKNGKDNGTNIKGTYNITLTAQTNKLFSLLFKVEGKVESIIEKETFRPISHFSEVTIGKKFVFKKMKYDFDKMMIYAEDKKGKYELKLEEPILEPLGIFYYFRLNPVKFDGPINLKVNAGKRDFPLTLFVRRVKLLKVPAGRFWAFLVQPTEESERQFDSVLNAPGTMQMWFSADEERIPLIVSLKVPFGTAQAVLSKIETYNLN